MFIVIAKGEAARQSSEGALPLWIASLRSQ